MKKIATLTVGILLGMNIALTGGNIPGVQAEEAPSMTAYHYGFRPHRGHWRK